MVMADFSGDEAEELRRAMSFHRSPERMARVEGKLRERMVERGVAPETTDAIIRSTKGFALYGLPESHAISFAILAYGSAWLKVHRNARVLREPAQQPAHGLLLLGYLGSGCQAARS